MIRLKTVSSSISTFKISCRATLKEFFNEKKNWL